MSSKEEIFDYVMETPQNTNPAILKDLLKDLPSSDLPDPSALTDGTAMVAVNGEWKMQEGYGYTGDPAFEPITWDGETEGRASVGNSYYKVSNIPISKSEIIGSTFYYLIGEESPESETIKETEDISDDVYFAGEYDSILVAFAPGEVDDMTIPEAGVYFGLEGSGEYSLTAPSTIHQFDSALIPSSGVDEFVVTFVMNQGVLTADKTVSEVSTALLNEVSVKGIYNGVATYFSTNSYTFVFSEILQSENMIYAQIIGTSGEDWAYVGEFGYPLTPAPPSEDGEYFLTCTITDGEAVYSWEAMA